MMMRAGFIVQQQKHQMEQENMSSNLTSASGEASNYSPNQQQHHHHHQSTTSASASPSNPNPSKKKRGLPGNPDPEAEVIALSPKSLMATNRFLCEVCGKGFQRDQNLQLHRRGRNLPWKLKTRLTSGEAVRRKVYVCPEETCVHHNPSRALGDLTGIKKHFSRKHGEKRWKCDKCSKRYAVLSDWKAHSKVCGTREYRCDCGTLFSRRDSFITHRAFCDALAEESARSGAAAMAASNPNLMINPIQLNNDHSLLLSHLQPTLASSSHHDDHNSLQTQFYGVVGDVGGGRLASMMKREQQQQHLPPWLSASSAAATETLTPQLDDLPFYPTSLVEVADPAPAPPAPPAAHLSATALLLKAAQMGGTMSRSSINGGHHNDRMAASQASTSSVGVGFGGGHGFLPPPAPAPPLFFEDDEELFAGGGGGRDRSKEVPLTGAAEGLTRDFLGLRALARGDILMNMTAAAAAMEQQLETKQKQQQRPWRLD